MTVKKAGGWLQKEITEVYENPWIRVTHEQVQNPKGTAGIYGVVHFKNRAVGVVPLDEEGNTWLVRQSRYPLNQFTWEIPEGGAAEGECTLTAGKRELQEETGLSASYWDELLRLHLSDSVTDEQAVVYVARGLMQGSPDLEDTEDIEVKRVALTEAVDMVMQGEITDAISVAALLKLAYINSSSVREIDV